VANAAPGHQISPDRASDPAQIAQVANAAPGHQISRDRASDPAQIAQVANGPWPPNTP
jgi:hypothetical protein